MTTSGAQQGIRPGVCLSTSRPASPYIGQIIYMTDVNQSAVWNGTSWVGYAPVAGNRNRIINGAFDIWQRGTSFSTSGSYTADRWLLQFNGSGATRAISQQSFTVGNVIAGQEPKFFFRYNQSVAGTGATFNLIDQRIEDVRTFAGQQVTVSFWAKADTTRTIDSSIQQAFDGSPEVAGLSSGTITLTTSWARYSYTGTLASIAGKTVGANSYAALRLNLPLNSTFVIDIWGVQLEAGVVATPFEIEDVGTTLSKCQRYYQRVTSESVFGRVASGQAYSTSAVMAMLPLRTTMRTTPTSIDVASLSILDGVSAAFTIFVLSIDTGATNRDVIGLNATTSGLTQFRPYQIGGANTSSGFVGISAEI
jgi:hypothetical protein